MLMQSSSRGPVNTTLFFLMADWMMCADVSSNDVIASETLRQQLSLSGKSPSDGQTVFSMEQATGRPAWLKEYAPEAANALTISAPL